MNTAVASVPATEAPRTIPSAKKSLVVRMAERFNVDADKLMETLKATAFRQRPDKRTGEAREPTNEEMMALLILADMYHLNPFTKELFAYLDPKSGAIIPVVSVDGWIRIINDQPTLRSLSFRYSDETVKHKGKTCHVWMECEMVRSDRDKPIVIREYFAEVVRDVDFSTPWDSHPNRMHRHKTLIQCGRVAFGFGGIYDEDEAARIIDGESQRVAEPAVSSGVAAINAAVTSAKPALEHNPGQTIPTTIEAEGQKVPVGETKAAEAEPKAAASETKGDAPTLPYSKVRALLDKAVATKSRDKLDEAAASIGLVVSVPQQKELNEYYKTLVAQLEADDGK